MAITQLNTADFDYAMMLSVINLSYKTQADISITNYDNDTAPQVTAGSIFVNNGAQFENTTLATPTGYAGLTNSTIFYLYYDESGGVFIFSNTAPTFSDAKQGWYNGNDRAFFEMFKDSGGTLYQRKRIFEKQLQQPIALSTKIIEIGDWNMNGVVSVDVLHGLTDYKKVRSISVIIRDDNDSNYFDLQRASTTGVMAGGINIINATEITVMRQTGGSFDNATYDSTSFDRGWITIQYEE